MDDIKDNDKCDCNKCNTGSCSEKENGCKNGKCWIAAIILVIIGILIVGIFFWLYKYIQNNELDTKSGLGRLLTLVPISGAVFWEASHLILFGLLGFFFPYCDAIVISIGAFWELIEHYLGLTVSPINFGKGEIQWWYGSAVDIAIDITGFYIGKSIRLLAFPEE